MKPAQPQHFHLEIVPDDKKGERKFELKLSPEVKPVPAKPKGEKDEGHFEFKVVPFDPKGNFKFEVPAEPPAPPKPPKPPQPPSTKAAPATPPVLAVKVPAAQSNRLEKLVGELLAAKKSDAEMLEALTKPPARELMPDR